MSLESILAVAATAAALYITTFVLVRIAGRRTVSQLSAFDVLVTIALGSVFATSAVSDPPSFGRGLTAVVTLLAMQVCVGALRQRVSWLRRLLDFAPETVARDGTPLLERNVLGPQLTESELEAAVRRAGVPTIDAVSVVILEPNGRFSVFTRNEPQP